MLQARIETGAAIVIAHQLPTVGVVKPQQRIGQGACARGLTFKIDRIGRTGLHVDSEPILIRPAFERPRGRAAAVDPPRGRRVVRIVVRFGAERHRKAIGTGGAGIAGRADVVSARRRRHDRQSGAELLPAIVVAIDLQAIGVEQMEPRAGQRAGVGRRAFEIDDVGRPALHLDGEPVDIAGGLNRAAGRSAGTDPSGRRRIRRVVIGRGQAEGVRAGVRPERPHADVMGSAGRRRELQT